MNKTTVILVLPLLACSIAAAPPVAATAPEGGDEDRPEDPICWRLDPTRIPPVEVWLCP